MPHSTKSFQSHAPESKAHRLKRKRISSEKAPFRKHRPHQDPSPKHANHGSTKPHSTGKPSSVEPLKTNGAFKKPLNGTSGALLEEKDERQSAQKQETEDPPISVESKGEEGVAPKQDSDVKENANIPNGRTSPKPPSDLPDPASSRPQKPSPATALQQSNLQKLRQNPLRFTSSAQSTSHETAPASKKRPHVDETVLENNKRRRLTGSLSKTLPVNGAQGNKLIALGLRNPHVLCYRRSVLQALLNIPIVVNWLLLRAQKHRDSHQTKSSSKSFPTPAQDTCLFCAFADLAQDMWHHRRIASLNKFDRSIRSLDPHKIHDWTRSAVQADAHEFLHALIDYIMEPRHGFNKPAPVVQGLFGLRIAREWTCKTCGLVHTAAMTDETGLQLPITNPPDGDIGTYLDGYFENDCVDARCENEYCPSNPPRARKGQRDPQLPKRRRKVEIASTPEVLFVQLMRFQSTYSASGRVKTTKLKKHVAYPRTLSLARYAMPCLQDAMPDSSPLLSYKLASVVAHSGSKDSGHYISFVESQNGSVLEISDESVRKSSHAEMLRPSDGFVPYILTYVRQDCPDASLGQSEKSGSSHHQASKQNIARLAQANGEPKHTGPHQKGHLEDSAKQMLSLQSSQSPSPSALGQLSLHSSSSSSDEEKLLDHTAKASVDFMKHGLNKSRSSSNHTSSVVQKRPAWASHGKKAKFGRARLW